MTMPVQSEPVQTQQTLAQVNTTKNQYDTCKHICECNEVTQNFLTLHWSKCFHLSLHGTFNSFMVQLII